MKNKLATLFGFGMLMSISGLLAVEAQASAKVLNTGTVKLEDSTAKAGDSVFLFKEVCQNPSGKGAGKMGCAKVQVGTAVVIEKLDNRKALVQASPKTKITKDLVAETIEADLDAVSGVTKE